MTYTTTIATGSHWSLRVKRGTQMKFTDVNGNGNLGMLFYNPYNLLERYNASDTLKCQHTFKLTTGHGLFSDMGHIFACITDDDIGWHETVSGVSNAQLISEKYGKRDYQKHRNDMHQNGFDSFLIEMAKYGLSAKDLALNLNLFSRIATDTDGNMTYVTDHSTAGDTVTLRFEMDTLVIMHTCPHPMAEFDAYPDKPIQVDISKADPVTDDDFCKNASDANKRGFMNNALYHLEV